MVSLWKGVDDNAMSNPLQFSVRFGLDLYPDVH